jgi:hypothetical protein
LRRRHPIPGPPAGPLGCGVSQHPVAAWWIDALHDSPRKAAQRSRHLLLLIAIALIGCLVGCESEPDDASLPSTSVPTTEARSVPPLPDSGDIDAGTYLVTSYTEPFEITVPDGWLTGDGVGLSKDDPERPDEGAVFVAWWPARRNARPTGWSS